jgi:transposase-like protein
VLVIRGGRADRYDILPNEHDLLSNAVGRIDMASELSEESGVVIGRRGRAEKERLAGLYRTSGMRRSEFCRSHGLVLSTLTRYLKKQKDRESPVGSKGVESSRLVAVEVASDVSTVSVDESRGALTVLLSNRSRVEVSRGFDAATLTPLVTVLERL